MGKEQAKIDAIILNDLSGGLNSNWLSSNIEDKEAKDCMCVIWQDDGLTLTPGFNRFAGQFGGTGSSVPVNGICDFRKRDGSQYLVAMTNAAVYYWQTDNWVDISGTVVITPYRHRFIVFNNKVLATNGYGVPFVWNGPGADVHNLVDDCGADIPPASAKFIATFNGRVVLMNYVDVATDRPTRACFSAPDNQNHWDLTYDFWEVDGDDGDEITGGSQLGNDFVLFTNNTINIISGNGTPWTVVRGFIKGVGCISGDSLVHAHIRIGGNLVECLTFMSHEGPKAFDGSAVYDLPIPGENEPIRCRSYFSTRNNAYRDNALSVYYAPRNWLIYFTTSNTDVENDSGCYYSPDFNSIWPFDNISANCVTRVWNDTTKTHDIYIGSYDGIIYILTETAHLHDHSTELITNGSMELDSDWLDYGTPPVNAQSGARYYTGLWSRHIEIDAVGEGIYQDITTVIGSNYRVYAFVYGDTFHNCCLEKTDVDGTHVVTSGNAILAQWTRLTIDFTATAAISRIIIRDVDIGLNNFYVDDVSCRCIDSSFFWESKFFDYGDEATTKYLREIVPFLSLSEGGYLLFRVIYDKGMGVTSTDTAQLTTGTVYWPLVDWTLFDWTSLEELEEPLESITQDAFRTHNIRIDGGPGITNFRLTKFVLSPGTIGKRWFT